MKDDMAWRWLGVEALDLLAPKPLTATENSSTIISSRSRSPPREFFDIKWTAVAGGQYYLLEGDDDPNFSAPQTLNVDPMQFGTTFNGGWGNSIPNIYYRVRAVWVSRSRRSM